MRWRSMRLMLHPSHPCQVSCDAVLEQGRNLIFREPELRQDRPGVRSEFRWRCQGMRVAAAQTKSSAYDGHISFNAWRVGKALHETAFAYLWMAEDGRHSQNFARRYTRRIQRSGPSRRRTQCQRRFNFSFQHIPIGEPAFPVPEPWISGQIRTADEPTQRFELLLPVGGDVEQPVRRRKGA